MTDEQGKAIAFALMVILQVLQDEGVIDRDFLTLGPEFSEAKEEAIQRLEGAFQ